MTSIDRIFKLKESEYLNLKYLVETSEQPFELKDHSVLKREDGYIIPENFWEQIKHWHKNFLTLVHEIEKNSSYKTLFRKITSTKKYLLDSKIDLNQTEKKYIDFFSRYYKLKIDNINFIIIEKVYPKNPDLNSYSVLHAVITLNDVIRLKLSKIDITVLKGDYRFIFRTGLHDIIPSVYELHHLNKNIRYFYVKDRYFIIDSSETDESGYTKIDREHLSLSNFEIMKSPYSYDLNGNPLDYEFKVNIEEGFLRIPLVSKEFNIILKDKKLDSNHLSLWHTIFIESNVSKDPIGTPERFINKLKNRNKAMDIFLCITNISNNGFKPSTWSSFMPISDEYKELFEMYLKDQSVLKELYLLNKKV